MPKIINIPRSQIMTTATQALKLILVVHNSRLSPACKRDIAAVLKARNNSKKQAC